MMDFTQIKVHQILSSILRPLVSNSAIEDNVIVDEEEEEEEDAWLKYIFFA